MISLVSTVFNDRHGVASFFAAMARQTVLPDEIVIVDAGSRDGTWEFLCEEARKTDLPWCLKALQDVRCNVARGRNLAIKASSGELIVSTDIGCDWDPQWLGELVQPLLENPSIELVNGSWAVRKKDLHGPWAMTEWALKGEQKFVASARCHPSSRSVSYRKSVWVGLGGYPEDLTLAADDAVFDFLIEKAFVSRTGAPVIRCYWHRHETLGAFLKEASRYGLGDGESLIQRKDLLLIGGRLVLEPLLLIAAVAILVLGKGLTALAGLLPLFLVAASVGIRIKGMLSAVARLLNEGVSHPLARILLFSYATKFFWIRGYFRGFLRGFRQCRSCRHRLRFMSPDIYRKNAACG